MPRIRNWKDLAIKPAAFDAALAEIDFQTLDKAA